MKKKPSTFLLLLLTVATAITTTTTTTHPPPPTTSPSPTSTPTTKSPPSTPTSPSPASTPSTTKPPSSSTAIAPSPASTPSTPTTKPPRSSSSSSTLDPKQLTALESLNLPVSSKDPCRSTSTVTCDNSTPFRHVVSLTLSNCSAVSLSATALKSLSTLHSLSFINCPVSPVTFPSDLDLSLLSFTSIRSFRRLSAVWLTRLTNLTTLTVTDTPISASGPYVIFSPHLKKLTSATISRANLSGAIPHNWHSNISHLDLSGNKLKGGIPSSIALLENLESLNLSSNSLSGVIPDNIGDLISLKNLSLSSNSLSGAVPLSISAIPGLTHLDLGSNQLNGTIPKFITRMKNLKYLNLEKNNFHGVMPFNASFIKKLVVFKIGDNSNLCYNHSTFSAKIKLGIAPCDKNGFPLSPPPSKSDDAGSDYSDDGSDSENVSTKSSHHGPSKLVLGVAIALSSIVFLIVFLILLSKCCK